MRKLRPRGVNAFPDSTASKWWGFLRGWERTTSQDLLSCAQPMAPGTTSTSRKPPSSRSRTWGGCPQALPALFFPMSRRPLVFCVFFWSHHGVCGILVSRPGVEPVPLHWSTDLIHRTAREVPTSASCWLVCLCILSISVGSVV